MTQTPRETLVTRLLGPLCLGLMVLAFVSLCQNLIEGQYASGAPARFVQDLASINQAIWNTANGDVLRASILYDGVRDHLELVLLAYSVIYRLGGDVHQIIQLQLLLVGLGAIPAYLIGRARGLGTLESFLLGAIYLLLPPMHLALWSQYLRPDLLFFPVMTTMVYGLVCDKQRVLIAAVVMSLFCKESASFTLFGLGAYLWWTGRERNIAWLCLLLGVLWLPLFHLFIVLVNGQASTTTNISERVVVPRLGQHLKLVWPVVLWAGVALLLRQRRWAVMAVVPHSVALAFYHVNIRYLVAPFAFVAALALDTIAQWRRPWARRALLAAVLTSFITANQLKGVWVLEIPSQELLLARPLMELIPLRAALCTERPLLLQLSERRYIYQFNRRSYFSSRGRDYTDAEYYLLRRINPDQVKAVRRAKPHEVAMAELDSWGMETVATSGPWTLYRKPSDRRSALAGLN